MTLWFEDEMRDGQKGRLCHRWWMLGKRPHGVQDQRQQWACLFRGVRPSGDAAFALVPPTVNTDTIQISIDRFAKTLAEDEHAVIVRGGAGWRGRAHLVFFDPPQEKIV